MDDRCNRTDGRNGPNRISRANRESKVAAMAFDLGDVEPESAASLPLS